MNLKFWNYTIDLLGDKKKIGELNRSFSCLGCFNEVNGRSLMMRGTTIQMAP